MSARLPIAFALLCLSLPACAQTSEPAKAPEPAKVPYYVDPAHLDLTRSIPPPPAQDSDAAKAELATLHTLEQTRTPGVVAMAKIDEGMEDFFLYANVLGPHFNADDLPLTFALSKHIRNDVSIVDGPLKAIFKRPRPYNFDTTLQPVCETNKEFSYPSGHAFNGYAYALVLTQMVPERANDILARADDYAHDRMVCEAHYPSDLEASRRAAYALFGSLMATPRFQADLAAARAETRSAMHLKD